MEHVSPPSHDGHVTCVRNTDPSIVLNYRDFVVIYLCMITQPSLTDKEVKISRVSPDDYLGCGAFVSVSVFLA